MLYFVFKLTYSQTDVDTCIVRAYNETEARAKIKANARYIDLIAQTGGIIQ